MNGSRPTRVCFVTASMTAGAFMRGQIAELEARGAEVSLITGPPPPRGFTCETVVIRQMERDPNPLSDVVALGLLVRALLRIRPDVLHVGTPKAALLGMIAGAVTRCPRRIYLVRGLRLETASGLNAHIFTFLERLVCRLAHEVVVVSPSLGDELVKRRIAGRSRIRLIGNGGSAGVDTGRYAPPTDAERSEAREELALAPGEVAVAFVGRIHPDKGVQVLFDAIDTLGDSRPIRVLLTGPIEGGDDWQHAVAAHSGDPRVILTGELQDVRVAYRAADIFVLPSFREGLPNVVLEAGACELPVITTDAVGCRDAIVDGVTGIRVPAGDPHRLAAAISRLAADPDERRRLGAAARRWVQAEFESSVVTQNNVEYILPPAALERRNEETGKLAS